jgi:hypothetical protein
VVRWAKPISVLSREIYRENFRFLPLSSVFGPKINSYINNLRINSLIDENREFSGSSTEMFGASREII